MKSESLIAKGVVSIYKWHMLPPKYTFTGLFALAYNLGNFLRRLALTRKVSHWSLTTLREKLVKMGAKVVSYSGYVIFQMAEVAAPRDLFVAILDRIGWLWLPPPLMRTA